MPRGGRALDVGCGKGEFLLRLVERHGCAGTGPDTNRDFLAEARFAQAGRAPDAAIEWREIDVRSSAGGARRWGFGFYVFEVAAATVRPPGLTSHSKADG